MSKYNEAQKKAQKKWYESHREEQRKKNRERYYLQKKQKEALKKENEKLHQEKILEDTEEIKKIAKDFIVKWTAWQNSPDEIDPGFRFIYLLLESYFESKTNR